MSVTRVSHLGSGPADTPESKAAFLSRSLLYKPGKRGYQALPQGCRQEGRRLGKLFGGQHQAEGCQLLERTRFPTTTLSGPRAPTRPALRSGLLPSTPKPGVDARVATLGPGSKVAPPRPALQPRLPSDGGAAPGNGALARSQL